MLDILDHAQQAFSSENEPSLYVGLPALEALHNAWSKRILKPKYSDFTDAIQAGIDKLSEYYDRTGSSSAYVISMILHPQEKTMHFEKHWTSELQANIRTLTEEAI
ncbi:hypothetical protein BT96DRAFT_1083250 [Gymnopus androsaceus JB14]|uniref:hAT-like transposase RNase-H fold domain-containing protein n=1 Tax=Gymnopus androsaceus JB14 TaxID=1447944 RepID=A0A6A4HYB0_9AGAR|nr:hypothetical protein BT96DRAFT_1083250 [Gymnopus androsaceus JB14]